MNHQYPETIIGLKLQPKGFKHGCFEIEVTGSRPPTREELISVANSAHPNYEFKPAAQPLLN